MVKKKKVENFLKLDLNDFQHRRIYNSFIESQGCEDIIRLMAKEARRTNQEAWTMAKNVFEMDLEKFHYNYDSLEQRFSMTEKEDWEKTNKKTGGK